MQLPLKTLLSLLPYFLQASALASGSGTTTRYWDCCKPSCAWSGKITLAAGSHPVNTCSISNAPLTDFDTTSACTSGGTAYQCSNESPWAVNDNLAYGYAAVSIAGGTEASWCCACYELTFTSGPVQGKKMVVQATNTGGDLGSNQFDISIPGGGVGIFNACTAQYGAPSSGWGAQYGGISSRSDCDSFPAALKDGCYWRFDWFKGADNPTVEYTQVACPAALTANTGCTRADDSSAPAGPSGSGTAVSSTSSSTAAPTSSSTSISTSTVVPVSSSTSTSTITGAPISVTSNTTIVAPTSTSTTASTVGSVLSSSSSAAVFLESTSSIATSVSVSVTTSAEAKATAAPSGGNGNNGGDDVCEF